MLTDTDLRAYLLGQLSEPDASRTEAQLLEDPDVFAALQCAEDDLIDEYARGGLSGEELERFVARYGRETGRLTVARALAQRNTAQRVRPFFARRWLPLAAAAALILGLAGLRATGRRAPAAATSTPIAVAANRPAGTSPPMAVVVLALASSRSAGGPSAAALPDGAAGLELRVRLDPADRYDTYTMELRSAADRVVWHADGLRATASGADLMVVAQVPRDAVDTETYELAVRGTRADAPAEPLGFLMLKVNRTP